jgi:hypothetical protein
MHRSVRLAVRFTGALMLVATVGVLPANAAPPGTPPTTGCPAHQLRSVASLEAEGPYRVPRQLDAAGNQDGFVCAQPMPPAATEQRCPLDPCLVPVIYMFRENDLVP